MHPEEGSPGLCCCFQISQICVPGGGSALLACLSCCVSAWLDAAGHGHVPCRWRLLRHDDEHAALFAYPFSWWLFAHSDGFIILEEGLQVERDVYIERGHALVVGRSH